MVVPSSIKTHLSFNFTSSLNSLILCPRLIFSEIAKTSASLSFGNEIVITLFFFDLKAQKVLIFLSVNLLSE